MLTALSLYIDDCVSKQVYGKEMSRHTKEAIFDHGYYKRLPAEVESMSVGDFLIFEVKQRLSWVVAGQRAKLV